MLRLPLLCALTVVLLAGCQVRSGSKSDNFDLIVRGGTIYDGSGGPPVRADVGVRDQRIVMVGDLARAHATREVDASGMAVAPGFVNMLSWAPDSLYIDGRSLSDLKQGVTLEIFGEGESLGPLTDEIRKANLASQGDLKHPIDWTTLGEGLDTLVKRGVSTNIASFVGAATVREHELGYINRARRLRADLCAGCLRQDAGVDCAGAGRRRISWNLYFAYAQ
jgi:N-acyl-D-amino-acid deacylase